MEATNGDMAAVGEMLIQPQRREVVVPRDPGLQGLDDDHQSTNSDDENDAGAGAGMDLKSTSNGNGHHVTKAEAENFGKSVYFDEDSDSTDEWPFLSKTKNGVAESTVKQEISDTNQGVTNDNEISPEISHEQEIKPEIPSAKVKSKHVKLENLIEESDDDEDVIELEFEREIKRLDTHTMHCPKCNAAITKVILRKKRTKKGLVVPPPQPEPVGLLGCLSCCSVCVPSGNCFSWIRLLANGEDSEAIPQQTNALASAVTGNEGNMVIDKEGDCFSLFRIFGNKPDKKSTQKPLQQPSYDSANAVGEPITNQDGGDRNLEGTPDVQVDQNAVPPVQNNGDSIKQNGSASINQNVVGVPSPNHQNGTYLGYPKPPVSTPPVDCSIDVGQQVGNMPEGTGDSKSLEIVKSIVYGGLMEFITSLSIVTSAAASGATTLNLITIGLANLIGGLIIIGHNLWDLKSDQCEGASNKYKEQLGKKDNFLLHATFAVLSFLVFGLIPPATYGYGFNEMNDKNLTLGAVAIASLICIIILASCKAYIMKSDKFSMYIKTIMYYICIALTVSGVSYEAGDLINKLIENYGWSEKTSAFSLSLPGMNSRNPVSWTSY